MSFDVMPNLEKIYFKLLMILVAVDCLKTSEIKIVWIEIYYSQIRMSCIFRNVSANILLWQTRKVMWMQFLSLLLGMECICKSHKSDTNLLCLWCGLSWKARLFLSPKRAPCILLTLSIPVSYQHSTSLYITHSK